MPQKMTRRWQNGGDREIREDQGEDEEIVDREAFLDDEAGEILLAAPPVIPDPQDATECDAQHRPADTPNCRLPERHDAAASPEESHVDE